MITENYVSFETAKLLKEKGFNKDAYTMYMYDKNGEAKDVLLLRVGEEPVLRPTIQMAMKWLREVHNLYIDPYPEDNNTWCLIIWKLYPKRVIQCNGKYDDYSYSTYEEACEAAIKYCLGKMEA